MWIIWLEAFFYVSVVRKARSNHVWFFFIQKQNFINLLLSNMTKLAIEKFYYFFYIWWCLVEKVTFENWKVNFVKHKMESITWPTDRKNCYCLSWSLSKCSWKGSWQEWSSQEVPHSFSYNRLCEYIKIKQQINFWPINIYVLNIYCHFTFAVDCQQKS